MYRSRYRLGGDSIKSLVLAMLLMGAGLFAQDTIPAGTILPVQLNTSLRPAKLHPGQEIRARLMQDVPLSPHSKIRAGARVIGHVTDVKTTASGSHDQISFRFDQLVVKHRHIPIVTNLRALAGMMAVDDAQVPKVGPDHGTSEYSWNTEQIGGETWHHSGSISRGSTIVGNSVAEGALLLPESRRGAECHGEVDGNDQPQALWLFSSDACGLYGLPNVSLVHAGRTDPVGQITLQSNEGSLNVRAGSGLLLRVRK
jgi:hypothetical protein